MSAIRFLLLTRAGFALTAATIAAGFAALAVFAQPAWLIDPLRTGAANTLSATGVAIALPVLWAGGVWLLFMRGILPALRLWRHIIGSGILVVGSFAVLSYFMWEFPIIGEAPLGGDVGKQLQGAGGAVGVLRTGALVAAGAWFIAPPVFLGAAKGIGRASAWAGASLARAYRARPLHRMAGRGVASVAHGAAERRRARAAERERERELARENARAESDNWQLYTPNSGSYFSVGIDSVNADVPDFLRGAAQQRAHPWRPNPGYVEARPMQGAPNFNSRPQGTSATEKPSTRQDAPWKAALESAVRAGSRAPSREATAEASGDAARESEGRETPGGGDIQGDAEREPRQDGAASRADAAAEFDVGADEGEEDGFDSAAGDESDDFSPEEDGDGAGQGDEFGSRAGEERDDGFVSGSGGGQGVGFGSGVGGEQGVGFGSGVGGEQGVGFGSGVGGEQGVGFGSGVGGGLGAGFGSGVGGGAAAVAAGPAVALPPLALLSPPLPAVAVSEEHEQTARDIEEALAQYGVEVQVNEIRPGPSVTMFGLVPGWKQQGRSSDEQADRGSRVKVNSILARKNDLALALRSPRLRVDALPGESLVVVADPDSADPAGAAEQIVATLAEHGIEVVVREVRRAEEGFLFGLEPGWTRRPRPAPEPSGNQGGNRVRVQNILAREKDLALALAAPSLRIQAPVPGESIVGIEVPNKSSALVTIRTVMESNEYRRMEESGGLPVALGLAPAGEPVAIDLAKMPHLLIAGSTGSGKSVCMNTIISSLIKDQPPSRVRMLLVDPKRVELTPYNGIPHLVTPVVVEPDQVVRLLRGAVQEMNRRYRLLEEVGVRNIQSYNKNRDAEERLPFFVICIDELADLMMTAPADVETCLVRLAQLARAVGIHLVVATQRPSVNVITGLIKANFPSRIAFYVASQVDSRTILDFGGAETLLGRGDMLFLSSDSPKARRVQGVYISEEETAALSDHWREQPPDPYLREIPLEEMAREAETTEAESGGGEFDESDSLYDRALQVAAANRQLSTSLLQRRLRIGYPRAARLMDQLEEEGIVASTGEPGKPREVIYIPNG